MNQKLCKKLRRLAKEQSKGDTIKNREFYRHLKNNVREILLNQMPTG